MTYDVIIIGSGPAGLTAAIYCARFGLSTVVLSGRKWGGQLMQTTDVENFPGFGSIMGPELMQKMRDHVAGLHVEIKELDVERIITDNPPAGGPFTVIAEGKEFIGKGVVVATGADTMWLGVPGEERLKGKGVSACAPCDAFFFRGRPVAVIGGGDSAMEEAHVIAGVASDTILIHRRDEFRAQAAMIDKVTAKKVRFLYNTTVLEILGEQKVSGLLLETNTVSPKQGVGSFDELVKRFGGIKKSDTQWILPREGVFVAIGLIPNTQKFGDLELDSHGYVRRFEQKDANGVIEYFTKTNIEGIFTAGDVHDSRYKQAITAAAFGCMAALDVQRWLSD